MALGPFPPDVQGTAPLFHGAEGAANGSFSVRWTGLACGKDLSVDAEYGDQPGSAVESADYLVPQGQRTPRVCESGCPEGTEATVSFPLIDDVAEEPVVELLTITLSNPDGGSLDPPTSAPFVLVDDDGAGDRVSLDDLEAAVSETHQRLAATVWRAGPAGTSVQVPYTAGAGGSTATADADYKVTSPNPLVFGPGERVKLVELAVVNDEAVEATETVEIALGTPTGAQLASPGSKILRILDNEESSAPKSRLHHPRQGRTYRADDYRLREIHVFTEDAGGSEVVQVQLAIRSNRRGGSCAWLTGRRFREGSCDQPRWLHMERYERNFFFIRLRPLAPSAGKTQSYTALSRARDGAGNAERDLVKGRNSNTFQVKPAPPR